MFGRRSSTVAALALAVGGALLLAAPASADPRVFIPHGHNGGLGPIGNGGHAGGWAGPPAGWHHRGGGWDGGPRWHHRPGWGWDGGSRWRGPGWPGGVFFSFAPRYDDCWTEVRRVRVHTRHWGWVWRDRRVRICD